MSKNIFVGSLAWATTSEGLEKAFAQYGSVTSAKVITDRETGRSKGFGFVEMATGGDEAIRALNGATLDGRTIVVNEARPRESRGGGGGGYGGGGRDGGGGYRGAGDGGPMRDRRADFSSAPPPPAEGGDFGKPARRFGGGPDRPRRDRDYEPRKRGFDDDQ